VQDIIIMIVKLH